MPASHIVLVGIPAGPLPIWFPACAWEGMEDGLHPRGRSGRTSGFWNPIDSAPDTVAIWLVNQWMTDLSVSPPLCESAFLIYTHKNENWRRIHVRGGKEQENQGHPQKALDK